MRVKIKDQGWKMIYIKKLSNGVKPTISTVKVVTFALLISALYKLNLFAAKIKTCE